MIEYESTICMKCNKSINLGIVPYGESLHKFQQCSICKHYYLESKSKERTIQPLMEEEAEELLEDRIYCPTCKGYLPHKTKAKKDRNIKDNSIDYQYTHIVAKGDSDRFYCGNHPKYNLGRIEFEYDHNYYYITIEKYFRDLNIYTEFMEEKLDKNSLLNFLILIKMTPLLIENLTEISRYKQKQLLNTNILKEDVIDNYPLIRTLVSCRDSRYLKTKIKLDKTLYGETIDRLELKNKKIFLNPKPVEPEN